MWSRKCEQGLEHVSQKRCCRRTGCHHASPDIHLFYLSEREGQLFQLFSYCDMHGILNDNMLIPRTSCFLQMHYHFLCMSYQCLHMSERCQRIPHSIAPQNNSSQTGFPHTTHTYTDRIFLGENHKRAFLTYGWLFCFLPTGRDWGVLCLDLM